MKTIFKIFSIIFFSATILLPQLSYSQSDTLNLDEILVKAAAGTSLSKTHINGGVILLENPHDGGAMFINQIGFGVAKRGNYGMEPVLRGFKYGQLNVQIDGGVHSSNACPNRMDPAISQFSPEEIEKIEVIKGPYSVRFGSAFGGIINIVNRKPARGGNSKVSGILDAGYQTNGGNYYTNLYVQTVLGKFDFSLNAGYKDYGNYKSGAGQEIASSFTRSGYAIKMGYQINTKQRLQLNWRQSSAKDVLYAGLPMDADQDNSSILSADYGFVNVTEQLQSIKIKMYGSFVDHIMSNTLRPAYADVHAVSPVNATVYGGRAELGLKMGSNNVFTGIDYKSIGKDGYREREVYKNTCTGVTFNPPKIFIDKTWQDSKQNDLGFFVENKRQLSSRLSWMLGLRGDFVQYEINDPELNFSEHYQNNIQPDNRFDFNITSSLSWFMSNNLNIHWAVARAMRAPELTELFINHLSVGMDAYEYIGNPELNSEVNYQTDFKIEKKWNKVDFHFDLFYSYLNDYISARVDSTIPRIYTPCVQPKFTKKFTNIEKAFMTGFEMGFGYKITDRFTYSLGAAYTYAQNVSWDEPLSEITPLTFQTALVYAADKIDIHLNARIVDAQNRVSTSFNETSTPGFAVFDFYLSYLPIKWLEIDLTIKNLLDKNYVEHLSRSYKAMDIASLYYEPGRSFNFGIKYKF